MQNIFEDLPSTDERALLKQAKVLSVQKGKAANKKPPEVFSKAA